MRVKPTWNPNGARTGRWSSKNPNMQNQPKVMRDLYKSSDNLWLVEADYKALEAWILALLTGDPKLLEFLQSGDIHTATAKVIFNTNEPTKAQRELAKRCRYALHYGSKPETAWASMVVDMPRLALSDVCKLFNSFEKLHPRVIEFHKEMLKRGRERDHVEAPLSGRRHYFHGQLEPTKCYNLPIQMTAADLINEGMELLDQTLTDTGVGQILIQVHDSLVCEGADWVKVYHTMRDVMERKVTLNGTEVSFPIDAKYGTNWGQLVEVPHELPS